MNKNTNKAKRLREFVLARMDDHGFQGGYPTQSTIDKANEDGLFPLGYSDHFIYNILKDVYSLLSKLEKAHEVFHIGHA